MEDEVVKQLTIAGSAIGITFLYLWAVTGGRPFPCRWGIFKKNKKGKKND